MERNVYEILEERGFLKQCSHPEELKELLGREKVTFYIGFDPTADSLHIGHYVALMTMAHMQRAGHRPVALLGTGTAFIGDPSGKTDMRRMMSREELDYNAACFQKQMARLIDFSEDRALLVSNGEWLHKLNFLDFMRDVGVYFSVNRMLTAECYKQRLEKGLTFFEMSYMLMQSYDFLELNRRFGCCLQMGGDDQWSNILSGADLIRRKERKPAYALTTSLLTTSDGRKMGKTEKGAVWLDKDKCSVYDFYQYWRNVADADVERCLALLTFLPMDEVRRLGALPGSEINEAKRVLAFTLTEQVHGREEAEKARAAAEALFGGGQDASDAPCLRLTPEMIESSGLRLPDLLVLSRLAASKSDARRLLTMIAKDLELDIK
ncbi:MAG: tyrosine--tRNA ligase, partial [Clostridia bacterium]|nr:tyrosine--tRNA ligase [Clostridia bacterium]